MLKLYDLSKLIIASISIGEDVSLFLPVNILSILVLSSSNFQEQVMGESR